MDSTSSSVPRMKCCGLPVEKGCLIFAIINMIFVSIAFALCLYYVGWVLHIRGHKDGLEVALNQIFCIIVNVFTAIHFIFAVLLCYGAHKKRAPFLKAYFVYGVILEILSTGGLIAFLVSFGSSDFEENMLVSTVAIILLVIYPFLLTLVYQAYGVLSEDTVLASGHSKLSSCCGKYAQ